MSGRKKVVLMGPAYPLRGGLASFNERLIREYIRNGDDARIYTFSLQYPSFLFPGKTQYSTLPPPEDLQIQVKVNSVNPLNWLKVGKELKKLQPDLVIVKFWLPFMAPCFGKICRIIKKNGHTRVVSILDNIIPHEKRPGDRFLAQYWVNSADGFIAMSRSVLDDLQPFLEKKPKPSLFCPHPLYDNFGDTVPKNTAKKILGLDENSNYILFFGFIRDYKGLDLLLNAMADPAIKKHNLKLIVAGEFYSDPRPYHDLIAKLGIEKDVILRTDFIPDNEVVNYFCASDVVVQPYKSATQSGVTQIAYHFDKPMIITNVGGLAEFVPDGKVGYVVNPDPAAIASAIDRFYTEGKESGFSANAAIEKQKYSWKKMIEAIEMVLNKSEGRTL